MIKYVVYGLLGPPFGKILKKNKWFIHKIIFPIFILFCIFGGDHQREVLSDLALGVSFVLNHIQHDSSCIEVFWLHFLL